MLEAAGIEAVPAGLYLSHFGRTRAGSYTHIYTQAGCAGRLRRNVFLMPKVELEADAAFITASASSARPLWDRERM